NAQTVQANEAATQEQVDAAASALTAAINGLVSSSGGTTTVTQTYASPAEAVAAGKVVTYLSMTPNVEASNRRWDGILESDHRGIDLYQVSGEASDATASTAITNDTDGVDSGKGYVIAMMPDESAPNKYGVMHYANSVTNQCSAVGATLSDTLHLFVFTFEDGGYTIQPISDMGKYLSLAVSGAQQSFTTTKTTFYITPATDATNGGHYYIWTATDPVAGLGNINQMMTYTGDDNTSNTWAFVGGRAAQGTFADIKLSRNIAGHFEEYIRWAQATDSGDTPSTRRQRFVTNTAYEGQTLAQVVSEAGWARVSGVDPKAAVYVVDAGDEENFEDNLESFVEKALALRGGKGFAVIIKGYNTATAALNETVDNVAVSFYGKDDKFERVCVIDPGMLTTDQLTSDGYPNAKGHLAIAEKLTAAVMGTTSVSNFPTGKNDAESINNSTWSDRLTENGVTIFGAETTDLAPAQEAIQAKMEAGAVTWLFMGDSITHGALWAEGEGALAQNFETFIKDDLGRKSDIIINTAVSNATSTSTVNAIYDRLNRYSPDVVSIMIGTNDESGSVSVADYTTKLGEIVDAVMAKDAILILRTPIPNGASGRGNNNYLYVDAMKAVYTAKSTTNPGKIILIDQFAEWSPYLMINDTTVNKTFLFNKVFTQDVNIHPGPVGHLWMTQEFINGLGLWDDDANVCKLSYACDWGIENIAGTVDLTSAYSYDKETRTLSVAASDLITEDTDHVISAEITVTVNGQTLTASYLRGGEAMSVTIPEGAESASISATALVSRNANNALSGKKMTFAAATIDLTANVEHPKAQAPETPVAYEYNRYDNALEDGIYIIVASHAESGKTPRAMHIGPGAAQINQCTSNVEAGAAQISNSCGDNHLFEVTRSGSGYTIKSLWNDKYLTGGASLTVSDTATEFTITPVSGGGWNISWVNDGANKYIKWDSSWGTGTEGYTLYLYRQEVAEMTVAQTEFKGTGTRPMDPENPETYYRIPSLITLKNGWIVATSDIRWHSTNDSPNNLDTIVSISKDGGETWNWEVVNYFADFPAPNRSTGASYGPSKDASASFIDPAVVQSEDGSVYLLVDVQPPHVNGGKIGTGFDSQGRLQISKSPVGTAYSMNNTHNSDLNGYTFDYYVDLNRAEKGAEQTVDMSALNGAADSRVKLWPICANDGDWATGYYVDAFFNTYYDYGEEGFKPVVTIQREGTELIHNNIFYTQSEWKAYPTAFIMVRKATVDEANGTLVWGEPKLLNDQIKHAEEHFIGVCPGRGITTEVIKDGVKTERIIFPVYDNITGTERASVIYSDDGGETWTRGARTEELNGTGKTSESQIVELPYTKEDGTPGTFLRMFSRSGEPKINYSDSYDGGATWSITKADDALNANNSKGQGCMVTFINVKGYLVGPDGTVYENLVLAAYPQGFANGGSAKRTNGTVRLGWYDANEGGAINWLNEERTWFEGSYIYSCLTQRLEGDAKDGAPSDKFALLYETDLGVNSYDNFTDIRFTRFDVTDVMGEGWTLVQTKPSAEDFPVITVTDLVDLDVNGSVTVNASATPGSITGWSSSDTAVATVDENGTITGVAAGRATVTVTASNLGLTKTAEIEVVVQDYPTIYLPERYENAEMTSVVVPQTKTQWELDKDGLESGVYSIVAQGNNRKVGMHAGSDVTNQCGASPNGDLLTVSEAEHHWTVAKLDNGKYTIQANNGKYLTSTASGNQLALSTTAEEFTIEHVGEGKYTVRNAAGQYLAFPDATTKWGMQTESNDNIWFYAKVDYVAGTTCTVDASGLEALVAAVSADASYEEDMSTYDEILALVGSYTG
ncbi:MAG: GDSL-type esterase/lipase family protein, partial [Roseburia sp.]|nr:GDSL-type esterase/lipase family protein [Roseburia sp.]